MREWRNNGKEWAQVFDLVRFGGGLAEAQLEHFKSNNKPVFLTSLSISLKGLAFRNDRTPHPRLRD
jgi:hypothetical protein